ncbi:DUF6660 family protein [Hyunsoonleella pacifica]|uniref:DUF2946 domain-containing protein n=1 Tax=Hyunsoonleella pacifica TaxID=1080224 RepID=A0A4V2JAR2_9FLAO|nr:DUF6660 family protein [Hyunsoonleella pacifica]TBN14378.1 hypothetical protein EYD46_12450 [Hyunsoonleella pacifica]
MKFATIILSLFLLFLSVKPCSDGQNLEDQNPKEISVNHNHQEDSDDSCPVTCICNCCGMSITYEPLGSFNLVAIDPKISTEIISPYQSIYRFDFHSNIWQPPQV